MISHGEFTDPETGLVVDSFEFESLNEGDALNARELVSMVLGIDADPAALLATVEGDAVFRRAVLALEYEPLFQGMHGGKLDAIAAERVSRAKDVCLVVEARIAAEAALAEFSS